MDHKKKIHITAIILAKNEEKKIEDAVATVSFCDEVLVINDDSSDKTREFAEKSGAHVLSHSKQNEFGGQRNWAMTQAKHDWILFIDADERVSPELQSEIVAILNNKNSSMLNSYSLPRRDFFWDHEMKYGETMKVRNKGIIRLMKKNSGVWVGSVHEIFISAGKSGMLHGFIDHKSHATLSEFIEDVNIYSTIRASELQKQGEKVSLFGLIFFPFGKFIYTYFILGGFLDGAQGFVYSFVMSFHSFLVRSKLMANSL